MIRTDKLSTLVAMSKFFCKREGELLLELNKLLCPQKIAIVGATEKETMAGFATQMFLMQCEQRREDLYLEIGRASCRERVS